MAEWGEGTGAIGCGGVEWRCSAGGCAVSQSVDPSERANEIFVQADVSCAHYAVRHWLHSPHPTQPSVAIHTSIYLHSIRSQTIAAADRGGAVCVAPFTQPWRSANQRHSTDMHIHTSVRPSIHPLRACADWLTDSMDNGNSFLAVFVCFSFSLRVFFVQKNTIITIIVMICQHVYIQLLTPGVCHWDEPSSMHVNTRNAMTGLTAQRRSERRPIRLTSTSLQRPTRCV